jgi:concanavalin A-like lectin/glucanase superfamily protein
MRAEKIRAGVKRPSKLFESTAPTVAIAGMVGCAASTAIAPAASDIHAAERTGPPQSMPSAPRSMTDRFRVYIDGENDSLQRGDHRGPDLFEVQPVTAHLGLGAVLNSSGAVCGFHSYVGLMDDLAIWKRALSPTEVVKLHEAPRSEGPATQVAPDAIVAHWPFDGALTDAVGHVDGIATRPAQFVDGVIGKAVALGPGSAEFVGFGNSFNEVLSDAGGAYTVSFWIRPSAEWVAFATRDQGPLFNKTSDSNCGQHQRMLYVFIRAGRVGIFVNKPDLSAYEQMSGTRAIRADEWQHIVVTYNARGW